MKVEDHPVDYAKFEGVIPEGEYGGGTVMVWDYGTYQPEGDLDPAEALKKGDFKFTLEGEKLKGSWVLVRTGRERQWLLIKHRDYYTTTEEVTELAPVSILSRRSLAEIAEDEGGDVKKAATGDPKKIPRRTGVKRRKKGAKAKVWRSNRAS
jgi:bifunctional non-homologous end joining protein LigD